VLIQECSFRPVLVVLQRTRSLPTLISSQTLDNININENVYFTWYLGNRKLHVVDNT